MIIGVTGEIGTGKTTVSGFLKKISGFTVVDADYVAKNMLKKGGNAYSMVVTFFGDEILKEGGEIDPKKLADIVFNDPEKLSSLNSMVHPFVKRAVRKKIEKVGDAIVDVPLLAEAKMLGVADIVLIVSCPFDTVKKRSAFSEAELQQRREKQLSFEEKKKAAVKEKGDDRVFVVDNSGDEKETEQKVKELWERIKNIQL